MGGLFLPGQGVLKRECINYCKNVIDKDIEKAGFWP